MAIDLPTKKYYTFIELAIRFKCSELDLRHFVIEKQIIPSLYLDCELYDHYQISSDDDHDGRHYWVEMYWTGVPYKQVDQQTLLEGFHFLIFPDRKSATRCVFNYFSKTAASYDEFNRCYLLKKTYELDFVMESGVVMASELARFEALKTLVVEISKEEKPMQDRERGGLLNIIGAMLELLQSEKPKRVSDTAVIKELVENYGDKYGISKSNLEAKLAAAKRNLRAN